MASIQPRIARFDTEPPAYDPHEGGYYIYTDIKQETVTDEMSGEQRIVWTATAKWQKEEPIT
jgi:hypothetical protein